MSHRLFLSICKILDLTLNKDNFKSVYKFKQIKISTSYKELIFFEIQSVSIVGVS